MGVYVGDLKRRFVAVRCPEEDPPGSVTVDLMFLLNGARHPMSITQEEDSELIIAALVSFEAFGIAAKSLLGSWYTQMRTSVKVGAITYNEREEFWKMYFGEPI